MSVFTIFNHGTDSHRERTDGEIIAEFGKAACGEEYRDFIITDGPGSTPVLTNSPNPMPGKFNPFTRNKEPKALTGKTEMGHTHQPSRVRGLAQGTGWNDNVIHVIAAISELTSLPTTINLIGWSRGAVTCTKIAYKLNEIYPQVPVNIFAIDPVAGTGNKGDADTSTLGPNVRNYVATLAMHEQRKGFKPQDVKRVHFTGQTNAIFLPFPGKHNTQVRLSEQPPEAAKVVWSLAYRFMTKFGSQFKRQLMPSFSKTEFANFYGTMRAGMDDYRALRQHGFNVGARVQGGLGERDFVTNKIDNYVVDADYFINEHHRHVFRHAYPKVYMFLFGNYQTGGERGVWEEFKSMYYLSGLMESLKPFGVAKPNPGQPFVLPVKGSGHQRGSVAQLALAGDMMQMGLL